MTTLITKVPGIGPATAAVLAKHGFKTAEDVAFSDVDTLSAVPGFGLVKSKNALDAALEMVGNPPLKKTKQPKKEKTKDKKKKGGKSGKKDKKKKTDKKGASGGKKKKKSGKKKK